MTDAASDKPKGTGMLALLEVGMRKTRNQLRTSYVEENKEEEVSDSESEDRTSDLSHSSTDEDEDGDDINYHAPQEEDVTLEEFGETVVFPCKARGLPVSKASLLSSFGAR